MKFLFSLLLVLTISGNQCNNNSGSEKNQSFTDDDATVCLKAFNNAFYNETTKVYNKSTDVKDRAAIWTQAIYWDMIMNAYKRTNDPQYLNLIHEIYEGACGQYDNFNWNNTTEWFIYDDIMWWVISLSRAYVITGEKKYLELAISGFDRVWYGSKGIDDRGSYDTEKGGMRWGWKRDEWKGKMACINYPTVIASALLYQITGKTHYLDKSKEIYNWSNDNLFNKHTGAVADSKHGDGEPAWRMHLYNQATCIGAGVILYQITEQDSCLKNAVLAADYVKNSMCDANGFFPFENGIEQGIYAAIFAQYIADLSNCNQPQYRDWLLKNINTAWSNRDKRNLTFKNFGIPCPEGDVEVYDASGCPALMQVIK
nr:glycoside hydrolase family 76 protein [uncultured Carboxylicivirga sp.]